MFPALKQNLGGHKFKDDCEVETAVTPWLIVEDTERQKPTHDMINARVVGRTVWKSAGMENTNKSELRLLDLKKKTQNIKKGEEVNLFLCKPLRHIGVVKV
jgi:hypothetical protein